MTRWAVFVSGRGSNLQNFLNLESELQKSKVVAVYANKECPAIERSKKAEKPALVLSPKEEGHSTKLLSFLKANEVQAIFMLGYMRILSSDFLKAWEGEIVNLHPSLLPKYPGLQAIERSYQSGDEFVGVSLHRVIEEVDAGGLLKQSKMKREPSWSLEETEEKLHELEKRIVREYLFDLEKN